MGVEDIGFCVTPLVALELAPNTRLASNSQKSACLCLLNIGIKGVCYHRPASVILCVKTGNNSYLHDKIYA